MAAIERRWKCSLMAGSVIATRTSRPSLAEDRVAPAAVSAIVLHGGDRPGSGGQALAMCGASVRWRRRARWSSASRAWSGSVGGVILSESLRPALGDQLVDEFAIAGSVGERAAQLLGCGAASLGCGVGRVRRPGHGLIVAGGVAASRRFADAAGGDTPVCLACGWGGGLQARYPGSAVGGRSRPGRESVANPGWPCFRAMQRLGVLGGLPPVAREPAEVPGDGRVRVAGENTNPGDGELRSFAPGARVVVVPSARREARTRWLSGGPLDVRLRGCRAGDPRDGIGPRAGHTGMGDRPVSRGHAGDRLYCVSEESRTGRAPRPSTSASGQRAEGEGRMGPPGTHAARECDGRRGRAETYTARPSLRRVLRRRSCARRHRRRRGSAS